MDRNLAVWAIEHTYQLVALRKESVDRNTLETGILPVVTRVALRKESVDRNTQRRDFKALGLPGRSPQGERG